MDSIYGPYMNSILWRDSLDLMRAWLLFVRKALSRSYRRRARRTARREGRTTPAPARVTSRRFMITLSKRWMYPLVHSRSPRTTLPVTTVSFDGITARVVRGDLECTNGYIHLLDRVIMKRRDVTLAGAGVVLPSLLAVLLALLL
jgi:hypothetical protein